MMLTDRLIQNIQNEYNKAKKWKKPTTTNKLLTLKRRLMRNICSHLKNDKMKKEFLENLKSYEWDTKWDVNINTQDIQECWDTIINIGVDINSCVLFPLLAWNCPFCRRFCCGNCPWKEKKDHCLEDKDSIFHHLIKFESYVIKYLKG